MEWFFCDVCDHSRNHERHGCTVIVTPKRQLESCSECTQRLVEIALEDGLGDYVFDGDVVHNPPIDSDREDWQDLVWDAAG